MLLCAVLVIGCGGIVDTFQAEEQSQPATVSYHAVYNGTSTLPAAKGFYHPTYFGGSNAHGGSKLLGGTAWEYGATLSSNSSSSMSATVPYPGAGRWAMIEVQYNAWANWAPAGTPTLTGEHLKSWNSNGTLQAVSGSNDMQNGNFICWIEGLGSQSGSGERQVLTGVSGPYPSGWLWRQTVAGYKALSGAARCAYLGEVYSLTAHAVAGQSESVSLGVSVSGNTCFFQAIEGSVDDGFAYLGRDAPDGNWYVQADGSVESAEAYCIGY